MSGIEPDAPQESPAGSPGIAFGDALRVWIRVALQSFGGPAGQIAVMHRIVVEEKRWVGEGRFLHALNYCMLLPGPEAQQLATYLGWLLHGTRGGIVAGALFVLPGCLAILLLSWLYASYQHLGVVTALLFGLKAAVLAVVVDAVVRIGRRVLKNRAMVSLAVAAFVAIFFFQVPFPWIILSAGLVGLVGGRLRPAAFAVIGLAEPAGRGVGAGPAATRPSAWRTLRVVAVCGLLWLGPIGLLALLLGPDSVYVAEGLFFSKAAVVTFGGAYAVLAYIGQQAVERYGWLGAGEMLDGLGMAETTPGPLIMVVQFVGFMGAYRHPGTLPPLVAGTLGSLVTTWVTFVPSFLWILAGAPWIERLRGSRRLSAALSSITAAVVGVVLNLGVWFSLHVVFGAVTTVEGPAGLRLLVPDWASLDAAAALLTVAALVALLRFKLGLPFVLGGGVLAGLAIELGLR